MNTFLYILISVFIVSLLSLSGIIFLVGRQGVFNRLLPALVAFASGTLLGGAFLHLIPEGVESLQSNSAYVYVLSGIISFFVLEKFFYWRHCHDEECEVHVKPYAWLNLLGDSAHNFLDGLIIAATYLIDFNLGVATTLIIISHEIPQEIGDFAVLVAGGLSAKKALYFNFFTALTSVFGAMIGYYLGLSNLDFTSSIALFAAGGFIYIAGADLIPELHKNIAPRDSFIQFFALIGGTLLMWALKIFY